MNEDYYSILGVKRDCTTHDIASAYRKMALLWHPDRNTSPEAEGKFNKLAEAYETLSNPEKRKQYDSKIERQQTYSKTSGSKPAVYRFTSSNANNIFESMFGKKGVENILKNISHTASRQTMEQDTIKKISYFCSLEDLYNGKKKIVKLEESSKMVVVEIPVGCKEGTVIPLKNPDTNNTVNYVIYSNKHPIYKRTNDDLHMNHTLTLAEYINGFSVNIVTLDNRKKKITHKYADKTVGPTLTMKLKSLGMSKENSLEHGDLYIHFSIIMPKAI
jgi:DnaJ homolog subfamily B member 4